MNLKTFDLIGNLVMNTRSQTAPVALFVYNRPLHTQKVVDALLLCDLAQNTELYIFSDGLKSTASQEQRNQFHLTRQIIRDLKGFKSIKIKEQRENLGLSNSLIAGINYVLSEHSRIIVLEDDLVPEKGFLQFMNDALELYELNEDVACIHGWNYSLSTKNNPLSTFFLRGADCWGWATWKNSWDLFEEDGTKLVAQIKSEEEIYQINRRNTSPYVQMLKEQIQGKVDSWAVRWYISLFLKGKYCLHPTVSVVKNIGFDSSGTHGDDFNIPQKTTSYVPVSPIPVKESEWFFEAYTEYIQSFEKLPQKSILNKLKGQLKKLFVKL